MLQKIIGVRSVFYFALYSSAQKIYTQNNNKIKPKSADTKKIRKVKKKAYANIVDFFTPSPLACVLHTLENG